MILPDLDPNEIGVIAFWNCHDHRVAGSDAVIDPTDVLGVLKSYTLYDNGVDGIIDYSPRTGINVRVKNDGWIIAWIDRTNQYQQNVSPYTALGYYDLLYNWKDVEHVISGNTNTLIEVINYLYNQLSNKADFNFFKSDVGTYCYEFRDINSITFAGSQCTGTSKDLKFLVTSSTLLKYLSATGAIYVGGGHRAYVHYSDGSVIADAKSSTKIYRYGVLDISTLVPLDAEDYIRIVAPSGTGYDAQGCIIAMWG